MAFRRSGPGFGPFHGPRIQPERASQAPHQLTPFDDGLSPGPDPARYLLLVPDSRPTPTQVVRKLLTRARTRGPGEVLGTGIGRVREAISSTDELVVLARFAGGTWAPRDDLEFVAGTPEDGERYARDIGTDSASTFAARLTGTTHCFLVTDSSKILHSSWVATESAWTRELGGYLMVPEGDGYVYESFTRADARGRGVYPFALKGICDWASKRGLRRVWVAVESGNPASLRAVSKAGFEPQFTISFRRSVGRLQVTGGDCPEGKIESLCLSRSGVHPQKGR